MVPQGEFRTHPLVGDITVVFFKPATTLELAVLAVAFVRS
jgi:hypothetical protein